MFFFQGVHHKNFLTWWKKKVQTAKLFFSKNIHIEKRDPYGFWQCCFTLKCIIFLIVLLIHAFLYWEKHKELKMWLKYRDLHKRRFSVAFRLFTPFLLAAIGFLCFSGKHLTTSSGIHTRYTRNDNRSNVNETSIVQHSHSPNLLVSTDGNSTVILPITEVKGFIGTDLISLVS